MEKVDAALTVFFEDPFWVGVFERTQDAKLFAAKVTFGAEPKDYEVYAFLLRCHGTLSFSPAVSAQKEKTAVNPKRLQRTITRQLRDTGVGTRSQQALKLQYEQTKAQHKSETRLQKRQDADRKFAEKQQKKKEKHRGR